MSSDDGPLTDAAATALCAFLSRALIASRANRSWPDLRALGGHVATASPAVHAGLGPPIAVDSVSGLLPWETWARLKADHRVALDEQASPGAIADGTSRRRYHDALRALPVPRLGDVEHALRSQDKAGRRLHVVLDKVESGGAMVRLAADVTVARSLNDRRFCELLFPMTSFPVELTLVRLLAAQGVVDVERVTRGAVDLCSCPPANVRAPALDALVTEGGSACAFAFSTCAADVTPGDNDLLPHESTALADLARAHLGSAARALPHRVYRDRKLVVTQRAIGPATAAARSAGTRTVTYSVEGP
jgi:hypothetical protein